MLFTKILIKICYLILKKHEIQEQLVFILIHSKIMLQ